MSIYDYGRWDGDEFVFNEPLPVSIGLDGKPDVMRKVCITEDTILSDGMNRDDVIHALLDGAYGAPEAAP